MAFYYRERLDLSTPNRCFGLWNLQTIACWDKSTNSSLFFLFAIYHWICVGVCTPHSGAQKCEFVPTASMANSIQSATKEIYLSAQDQLVERGFKVANKETTRINPTKVSARLDSSSGNL